MRAYCKSSWLSSVMLTNRTDSLVMEISLEVLSWIGPFKNCWVMSCWSWCQQLWEGFMYGRQGHPSFDAFGARCMRHIMRFNLTILCCNILTKGVYGSVPDGAYSLWLYCFCFLSFEVNVRCTWRGGHYHQHVKRSWSCRGLAADGVWYIRLKPWGSQEDRTEISG